MPSTDTSHDRSIVGRHLGLVDRTLVISGGSGSIGQFVVSRLTSLGANVVIADIGSPDVPASVDPERCHYVNADVSDRSGAEEAVGAALSRFGRLDVACCHAAVMAEGPIAQIELLDFDRAVRHNLRGSFALAQSAARHFMEAKRPGHLVFTSSWVESVPWPGIAPYIATKAAIRALMRSFARELAPYGIRANGLAPGIVDAGLARRQWNDDPDYRRRASRAIPLGHLQPPESVADAFVFLVSDLASYMTGSTLLVDGGCSLYPMDES